MSTTPEQVQDEATALANAAIAACHDGGDDVLEALVRILNPDERYLPDEATVALCALVSVATTLVKTTQWSIPGLVTLVSGVGEVEEQPFAMPSDDGDDLWEVTLQPITALTTDEVRDLLTWLHARGYTSAPEPMEWEAKR